MKILPPGLLAILCAIAAPCCSADVKHGEMYGYLLFDGERVPKEFNAGALASLDPALILTPPRGMEAGYVPIATRQQLAGPAARPHDHGKGRP
jgi:hypothetical protein